MSLPTLDHALPSLLGPGAPTGAAERLRKYLELLVKWQRSIRLVGSSDRDWILENVVLDSLLFTKVLPMDIGKILDLGSGAGVPGVPLAVARPELDVTLVEARRKRASFLAQVVRELGLTSVRVVSLRLTEQAIPAELVGAFDAVVMRCAGDISSVLPVASRLLRPDGLIVASGPPDAAAPPIGDWRVVPGIRPGALRRFLVVHPGEQQRT